MNKKHLYIVEFTVLTLSALLSMAYPTPGFSLSLILIAVTQFITQKDGAASPSVSRLCVLTALALLCYSADLPRLLLVGRAKTSPDGLGYLSHLISPAVWKMAVLIGWFMLVRRAGRMHGIGGEAVTHTRGPDGLSPAAGGR